MATTKRKPILDASDEDEDLKFVRPRVSIKMINGASPYFGVDQSVITRIGNVIIGGDYSGETRGEYTIDFQIQRTAVTQVASGLNSIAIGNQLTASGWQSIVFGYQSRATASSAVAFGVAAAADGAQSVAIGDAARAVNDYGISIGSFALSTGIGISVGNGAESANDGVGIGDGAIAAARGIAIGASTTAATDEVVLRGLHLYLQTDAGGTKVELMQGTGSGAAGRLAYWSGTSTLTSSASLTYSGTLLTLAATATGSGLTVTNTVTTAVNVGGGSFGARTYASSAYVTGLAMYAALDAFYGNISVTYQTAFQAQVLFANAATNTIGLTASQAMYIASPVGSTTANVTITTLYGLRIDAQAVSGITPTTTYYAYLQGDSTAIGTSKYGLYIGGISGAGTNNYSIYTNGGLVHFGDSVDLASGKNLTLVAGNIVTDTTTGTKIGTATNQKIGFYNATPIAQGTTAIAGATFVANVGTAVNDASTFDGYTLKQVVKALRNLGLLA